MHPTDNCIQIFRHILASIHFIRTSNFELRNTRFLTSFNSINSVKGHCTQNAKECCNIEFIEHGNQLHPNALECFGLLVGGSVYWFLTKIKEYKIIFQTRFCSSFLFQCTFLMIYWEVFILVEMLCSWDEFVCHFCKIASIRNNCFVAKKWRQWWISNERKISLESWIICCMHLFCLLSFLFLYQIFILCVCVCVLCVLFYF